jgi:hypothetical protein
MGIAEARVTVAEWRFGGNDRRSLPFDWQPRCLFSKTGGFASRPHDRFAFSNRVTNLRRLESNSCVKARLTVVNERRETQK